jgi:hypothetical protein
MRKESRTVDRTCQVGSLAAACCRADAVPVATGFQQQQLFAAASRPIVAGRLLLKQDVFDDQRVQPGRIED